MDTPADKEQELRLHALARDWRASKTSDVRLIETHISRLLLAGDRAYKFKRPVDLGFLDYSTLERRRHFCHEEVRLNRRTAPDLYLGVVGVAEDAAGPRIARTHAGAVDFAVEMRRFPERELMSRMLEEGRLEGAHIDALARTIAEFHQGLPGSREFGSPEAVYGPMAENFRQIRQLADPTPPELDALEAWTARRFAASRSHIEMRRRDGRVRECHGDLHLNNIIFHAGRPEPFDGIEFNANLRFIDTVSEIAFLTMDLTDRDCEPFAHRFLTAYLEYTGDFEGLDLLRFYQTYRAMVRAKVAAIRVSQSPADSAARREFDSYLVLALRYTRPQHPFLLLTCGLSGSGKTTLSQAVVERMGTVRARSDVERKRLFGLSPEADSESAVAGGIYTPEATDRTYARLATVAGTLLAAELPAVIDATFLDRRRREVFLRLARERKVPFAILHADAPVEVLRSRITARSAARRDASEADIAVLEAQLRQATAPGPDEPVVRVDTSRDVAPDTLVARLREQLGLSG